MSRSGQLQEQGFSVEVAERIAAPERSSNQQGPSTSQSGPYLRNGAEKFRWISPVPLQSKFHVWVANQVRNLGQWEKVTLFPSSDFIAKNLLAREGSQSMSPVTIPALTAIVDRQFKEDRILCPVQALRYYLD